MIALFWNLSPGEIVVVLVLAVLIFGKRLPQVAGETMRNVSRLRRHLGDLRRDSGIDRELFEVQRTVRDVARDIEVEPTASRPYPGKRAKGDAPAKPAWASDRREDSPDAAGSPTSAASAPSDVGPKATEAAEPGAAAAPGDGSSRSD